MSCPACDDSGRHWPAFGAGAVCNSCRLAAAAITYRRREAGGVYAAEDVAYFDQLKAQAQGHPVPKALRRLDRGLVETLEALQVVSWTDRPRGRKT